MEIYTIGFTQTTAEHFFGRLKAAGIQRLLDVRLNNSSQLAGFAKARDLPYFLRELLGASYEHDPRLAPTQTLLDDYKKRKGDWAKYEHRFLALMAEREIEHALSPVEFATPSEGTQVRGRVSPSRYLELLTEHACRNLYEIFGAALARHDWNYATDKDSGTVSLGVLRARRKPDLEVDRYGKLRLRLNDEKKPAFLSVTDVRFVEADHKTIKSEVVADVRERMRRGVEVLLMLGLARAFQKPGDDCERHWLQVNGICMTDRPLAGQP